jgi:hypothetical protein
MRQRLLYQQAPRPRSPQPASWREQLLWLLGPPPPPWALPLPRSALALLNLPPLQQLSPQHIRLPLRLMQLLQGQVLKQGEEVHRRRL